MALGKRGRPLRGKLEEVHTELSRDGKTSIHYYDWEVDKPTNKWTMVCINDWFQHKETITYYFDRSISNAGPYKIETDLGIDKNTPKPKVKQKRRKLKKKKTL